MLEPGADPFDDALVGAIFPKTTARAYTAMLAIANTAMRHHVSEDGGKVYHHVAFHPTANGANGALALMDLARTLAGFQLYTSGRVERNTYRAAEVLTCFINAERCTDPQAWCHAITDNACARHGRQKGGGLSITFMMAQAQAGAPRPETWLYPCRFLLNRFQIDHLHPSRPVDQLEASAIEAGCHWCPRFNPNDLRQIEDKE